MLIAHVEQQGVWLVEGGMIQLATELSNLATRLGAVVRLGNATVREITVSRGRATGVVMDSGERIEADAVVCNTDCAALATGALGNAVTRRSAPAFASRGAIPVGDHLDAVGRDRGISR